MRRLVTLIFAIVSIGCSGNDGSTALLDVTVRWVPGTTTAGQDVDPRNGVTFLRFTVSGPGISDAITTVPFDSHQANLPEVSYGYARQVTIEACATGACERPVVARGRSVPFTMLVGDPTRQIDVFVTPTNSFSFPTSVNGDVTRPVLGERLGATVTLLNDGRLLIAGGAKPSTQGTSLNAASDLAEIYDSVEIFDPRSNTFSDAGKLTIPRAFHQAIKLESKNNGGKVVFLGGYTKVGGGVVRPTSAVEMYDPDTGKFTQADKGLAGNAGRAAFTAALAYKDNDIIFIAGGVTDPPAASGFWDLYVFNVGAVGHGKLGVPQAEEDTRNPVPRWNQTITYLPNYRGKDSGAFVLMGGENDSGTLDIVEAYVIEKTEFKVTLDEEAFTSFSPTISRNRLPGGPRTLHQTVFVPEQGIVYVFGGFAEKGLRSPLNRIDIYREGEGGFIDGELLLLETARGAMTATLMDMNTIFVVGGLGAGGTPLNSGEVVVETMECNPDCYYMPKVYGASVLPVMPSARYGHSAVFDSTHRVFIVGGLVQSAQACETTLYYNPE